MEQLTPSFSLFSLLILADGTGPKTMGYFERPLMGEVFPKGVTLGSEGHSLHPQEPPPMLPNFPTPSSQHDCPYTTSERPEKGQRRVRVVAVTSKIRHDATRHASSENLLAVIRQGLSSSSIFPSCRGWPFDCTTPPQTHNTNIITQTKVQLPPREWAGKRCMCTTL